MSQYTTYEKTGISWNTSKPSHWNKYRGKRIFFTQKQRNTTKSESNILSLTLKGVIRNDADKPIGLSPSDYSTYQIFDKDDLVFKLIDLNNISTSRVGIVPERGIMSSAYIRLTPRFDLNIRYFFFQYYDLWLRNIYNGLGAGVRQTLGAAELLELEIVVPPREEQDQIVRFLDWKVSSINKLINIKQAQIACFNSRILTKTGELVMHGIARDTTLINTNMDWAPTIPSSWSVSRIRNHFEILKRIAGEEGFDVFSVTQQGLKVRDVTVYEGQLAANYSGYQFVYPGEFAMNHMDLLTGGVGIADHLGVTSPDYRVFRLFDEEKCYAPYYLQVFQLCYRRHAFYRFGKGAANVGRWRLPATAFKNFEIPLPPYSEQVEIVKVIELEIEKNRAAIECLQKQIETLKEFKTRLISDVVTGKIDVRGIEIPEYEFVDEDTEVEDDAEDFEESEAE